MPPTAFIHPIACESYLADPVTSLQDSWAFCDIDAITDEKVEDGRTEKKKLIRADKSCIEREVATNCEKSSTRPCAQKIPRQQPIAESTRHPQEACPRERLGAGLLASSRTCEPTKLPPRRPSMLESSLNSLLMREVSRKRSNATTTSRAQDSVSSQQRLLPPISGRSSLKENEKRNLSSHLKKQQNSSVQRSAGERSKSLRGPLSSGKDDASMRFPLKRHASKRQASSPSLTRRTTLDTAAHYWYSSSASQKPSESCRSTMDTSSVTSSTSASSSSECYPLPSPISSPVSLPRRKVQRQVSAPLKQKGKSVKSRHESSPRPVMTRQASAPLEKRQVPAAGSRPALQRVLSKHMSERYLSRSQSGQTIPALLVKYDKIVQ